MTERYNVSLPESLEQLSTPQLDAMLHAELHKEQPDDHAVRLILKVLKAREADFPVQKNAQLEQAWKTYTKKTEAHSNPRSHLSKIAAVLALCCLLLFMLPQKASADNLFHRMVSWTENFFRLLDRDASPQEYVFRTTHPGLQQLYDTVTELGVTTPVVPMWLDEAYELISCKVTATPVATKVLAFFNNGNSEIAFELNIYSQTLPRDFQKNNPDAQKYEFNNIIHYMFQNQTLWSVVWTNENLECALSIDSSEDDVYRMIDSIYIAEE